MAVTKITGTGLGLPTADGNALGGASNEFSDLYLADGSIIYLGADQDVTLTHVADTGILLNSTRQLQFNDSSQYINAPSATVLDINATDEIELNATLADINANLDVSGTYTGGGLMTTGGNIVIPNAGNIGSASDTDAIAIASTGAVTFSKQVKWAKGGDLASATTLTIDTDGNYFDVTGTTTITAFSTIGTGTIIKLHFDGALILTHHVTNLILPGAENITTAPGDEAEFVEYASADWRCTSYTKATSLEHPDAVILNSTDGSSNAGDNVILDASASGVDVGSALIYEVATGDHLLNKFSMEKGADIASADPLVIGTDGNYFDVTGTTTFTSMNVTGNRHFFLQFDGALTLTHDATKLDLPGEANITTAAGDVAEFFSIGNKVQCVNYTKAAGAAQGLASFQIFTSSGTYTKPSGLVRAMVITTGGGGGGAGGDGSTAQGHGGGAGGGTAIELLEASEIGGTETVTIGAAGAAGSNGNGGNGGTSSFGSLNSATGGQGGRTSGNTSGAPGGLGSGGDLNLGGGGAHAIRSGGADHAGSNGGASYWGGGVYNRAQNATGLEANSPGSGGSGAYQATGGGAGAAGIVVVWEYK